MKKITMYSGDPCPYCAAAKAKEMLQRTNGARTIPQIFIGDHYVGGNDQLQAANRNGELDKLLA